MIVIINISTLKVTCQYGNTIIHYFQWACLPLIDNVDEDTFEYQIHVYTGQKSNAGTRSNVYFQLFGEDADTGVRRLEDGMREVNAFD